MAAIATPRRLAADMEDATSCCSDDTVLSVGTEEAACENLSFKNIESHLNAISQMTASSEEKSPPSPALSPSSSSLSPSPSCYRSLDFRASPSLFRRNSSPETFCSRQNNNNETNGASLKFSIDNILKADFGRRITEPMNVRKARAPRKQQEEPTGKPVDLSKGEGEGNAKGVSGTTTDAVGQQQPMLWPAWVYCTRYSDRPSSGEYTLFFIIYPIRNNRKTYAKSNFQKKCNNSKRDH